MGRALRAVTVVFVGAAALGPATAAATADATATTTSTTATNTPAPAQSGSLALYLRETFGLGSKQVTIPGRAVRVDGVEHPYVPGQKVTMSVYLNGRLVRTSVLQLRPNSSGKYGRVSTTIRSPHPGHVTIVVKHSATSTLLAFSARHGFDALDDHAGFGSRSDFVRLIQKRLSALHFYVPQSGSYDAGTGLAIDAYHRLMRWGTYQTLDQRTVDALLDGRGKFSVRYPGDGKHAEGNLSLQLLALINGSHVYWILPISSGKPSTPTVLGRFHVYRKSPGLAPDGMYYSSYFFTGYAIHGFNPAPDFAASHGCMRLPMADAIPVYNWLQIGNAVDTYF
jgi:hypothetical protein